jgi:hypothetical protein
MTLLSERLPNFYAEHFNEEMEGTEEFIQLREHIKEMPGVVASSTVSNAILNLNQRGYSVSVNDGQEEDITEFIEGKLKLLVEDGSYATKIQFISEPDYAQNEFLQIFDGTQTEEAIDVFNEELWREVRERYNTASLSEVLKRIGSKFTDKRPVIVFEDFSITSMEAGKLAKFIESDQTESAWDFIIAGTRDSTGPLHTQTAESRYEFYQTNRQDSQKVLFLDRESAVDFIRPYLGYFKSFDESVTYDREDGTFELLPAPTGSRCSECGFCEESFRDLFPFNEVFLRRIYSGMEEAGQESPREYIMAVFDVLSDYYEGKVDVPSNAKSLKPLVNRLSVADTVYENAESYAYLARWYGHQNDIDETIEVDRRFGEAFGLISSTDSDATVPDPLELTTDSIIVPTSSDIGGVSETGNGDGNQDDTDSDDDDTTGGGRGDGPEQDPVEIEFEDKAPILDAWKNSPRNFKETTKYLERGLEDALERLTDGFSLYEGTPLEYSLSSEKRPFVFSITEETPDDDQIVVDVDEFRLSDLRSVLRFGIEREMTPRGADYQGLFADLGTQLTGYAREWRNKVHQRNLDHENVLYKGHADYDFEDFILASYSYIVLLDSPWKQVNATTVCQRYGEGEYSLDSGVKEWLENELEHESFNALTNLLDAADHVETMVGELFGVSSSNLNQLRIDSWFNAKTPRAVLSQLGRSYINNISSRVRFSKGVKLRTLGDTAYDVCSALDEISQRYQEDIITEVKRNLSDLSMDNLAAIISNLDTYDVDPDVMEPLKKFNHLTQSDVEKVVNAADLADDIYGNSTFDSIQATLMSIKIQSSSVFGRYQSIPSKTSTQAVGIGQQFQEVSQYYVK